MQRESMPWLREREGQVWTSEDTERVERMVAEVEATYQQMHRAVAVVERAHFASAESRAMRADVLRDWEGR